MVVFPVVRAGQHPAAVTECRALPTGASEEFRTAEMLVCLASRRPLGLGNDDCTQPLLEDANKVARRRLLSPPPGRKEAKNAQRAMCIIEMRD